MKVLFREPKKWLKYVYTLLLETFNEYNRDKAIRYGAAVSYYTLFSLPAVLIIVIRLAGIAFGEARVKNQVLTLIADNLSSETANQVNMMMENIARDNNSFWATLLSVGTLIFGASGVFNSLRDALNIVWKIRPHIRKGSFLKTLFDRLLSFTMVLTLGFILLVSMVLHTLVLALQKAITRFSEQFREFLSNYSDSLGSYANDLEVVFYIAYGLETLIGLIMVTLTFSLIFKFLADAYPSWKDVLIGALFTAILFNVGKLLIGWYLSETDALSAYGAAGSVVLILLWVYYSSQILLLGAEFVYVYTKRHGRAIEPSNLAISLIDRPIYRFRKWVLQLFGQPTEDFEEEVDRVPPTSLPPQPDVDPEPGEPTTENISEVEVKDSSDSKG